MSGDVAFVREQGVSFAVVCVPDRVAEGSIEREGTYHLWTRDLGLPVVLMGANRHYCYGHKNIVPFVSSIDPRRLPWRRVGA